MRIQKLVITLFAVIQVGYMGSAMARGNGGWTVGGLFGIANADQSDMDSVISRSRTDNTTSAGSMGNGLEFGAGIGYTFSNDVELLLRGSYYMVSEDGGSNYEYAVNAINIYPMLRFMLLSSQTIKFYSQLGIGYTLVTGSIEEQGGKIEFSGGDMGYLGGLGAEFCFFGSHCFYVEGNMRIASVDRVTVDKYVAGSYDNPALTQKNKGQELEISNRDFSSSLSGIQGVIGYNYHF